MMTITMSSLAWKAVDEIVIYIIITANTYKVINAKILIKYNYSSKYKLAFKFIDGYEIS